MPTNENKLNLNNQETAAAVTLFKIHRYTVTIRGSHGCNRCHLSGQLWCWLREHLNYREVRSARP